MALDEKSKDLNLDPITDEPGAHPVGTGLGAVAGGAAAGAAAGAFGGPVGAVAGAVVGAVAGGLGGKAVAEAVNPTAEQAYWRDNYNREPYYEAGHSFDDYGPAYGLGVHGRSTYGGTFDETEDRLSNDWTSRKERSSLSWEQAREPSRAAWTRVDSQLVGSSAAGNTLGSDRDSSYIRGAGTGGVGGVAGSAQRADDTSRDSGDVVDTLDDLAECCKDGEYGFRACAEQAERQDLKSLFMQRADGCRDAAQELYTQIRALGGKPDEGGSAAGALHRGWVSVKAALSTYDDKAVLEECERGEDNALARYRKAMKQTLPANIRQIVERQMQGVQRNHDQIKSLRDSAKANS